MQASLRQKKVQTEAMRVQQAVFIVFCGRLRKLPDGLQWEMNSISQSVAVSERKTGTQRAGPMSFHLLPTDMSSKHWNN